MLQNMQSRLRKKIKKRGGASSSSQGVGSSGEAKSDGKVDIRVSFCKFHDRKRFNKLLHNKYFPPFLII
jgi:hypothetical protein